MVPHKHYAASEIEDVLWEVEDAGAEGDGQIPETHAEESTLRRWIKDFSVQMPLMAGRLEQLASELGMRKESLMRLPEKPLQRLRRIVELLQEVPLGVSRLASAFGLLLSHPIRL
jgi:hypothetical protein